MSTRHSKAAKQFLKNGEKAQWQDNTLWGVRVKRDRMAKGLDEWESLRNAASDIKKHTLSHLDIYLEKFASNAEANGVNVHWAKDAEEFNAIVLDILQSHDVRKLVKSKSMLTEECEMNPYLETHGIEVVETDLGERIIQLLDQKPSHIVMPAIHLTQEEVGELFEKELGSEKGNSDPTYLTYCARESLRNEFLTADAGLTGANFGVAETGEIVICTNEGNADMSTSVPKLHIAAMGIEKVIPDHKSLAVFHRLLARSATGQPSTTFTSHFRKPRPGGEMHIILVDNGRSSLIANESHWETLKCIRCGACMNTCPVYRRSGGYSYTYFIPGPIGINLGMARDAKKYHDNASACSLCCSCDNVCPAKVNLSEQIYSWRQELKSLGKAPVTKEMMSRGMKTVFDRPALYNLALKCSPLINAAVTCSQAASLHLWGKGRSLPEFAKESFHSMWVKGKVKNDK